LNADSAIDMINADRKNLN